jgi:hypothetical protein
MTQTQFKGNATATGSVKRNKLGELEQEFFEPANGSMTKVPVTAPIVIQTYPWLIDMLGCWYAGGKREIRLYRN